jgi:hypothetical protein
VVPEDPGCPTCGRGIGVTPAGDRYYADQVTLLVEASEEDRVTELLGAYGFEVLGRIEARKGTVTLLVEVPLGSAPAAVVALSSEKGVISAELGTFFHVGGTP